MRKLPDDIDKECIDLCNAINSVDEKIYTIESCCGHKKGPYHIWVKVEDGGLGSLPIILYWFDSCHLTFGSEWRCVVSTDCGMSHPTFLIEGPKGAAAYEQSQIIARQINKHVDCKALEIKE